MTTRHIAVTISNANKTITPLESIKAVKDAGFENVFIEWYNKDWEISQQQQLDYMRKLGLKVVFAHLGYQKINNLWVEGEEGESLTQRFIQDISICKERDIDLVVMHLTSKSEAPGPNETGLNRLRRIVNHAKSLGVKVAFENTKIKGYLDYVIKYIDNDYAGICFDAGHYHAHFNDELDFDLFKNRIFAVHLHDNHGNDNDEHLIPFDGTLDWKYVMNKLKECNYTGPVTMELVYRNDYLSMTPVEFYKKGLEVGLKLREYLDNTK